MGDVRAKAISVFVLVNKRGYVWPDSARGNRRYVVAFADRMDGWSWAKARKDGWRIVKAEIIPSPSGDANE
jgi:hypothetical protein